MRGTTVQARGIMQPWSRRITTEGQIKGLFKIISIFVGTAQTVTSVGW